MWYTGGVEEVNKFFERVRTDFTQLRFREGRRFSFRPPRTIIFPAAGGDSAASGEAMEGGSGGLRDGTAGGSAGLRDGAVGFLGVAEFSRRYEMLVLHEVGHALLGHKSYMTDPERLKMESEAWGKAEELCRRYGVEYDAEFAEGELDSYREWLHRRSKCRECGLTRYQTRDGEYHCPGCREGARAGREGGRQIEGSLL